MDNKQMKFIKTRWKEALAGALMIVGLILSFFFLWTGGFFVGLGLGLCFDRAIVTYCVRLKSSLTGYSLFTNLMLLGALLYLLITITTFVIGVAIGIVIMLLIRWNSDKRA